MDRRRPERPSADVAVYPPGGAGFACPKGPRAMRTPSPETDRSAPRLLDVNTAAETLNIPARLCRDLFSRRAFPLVKIGRRLFVTEDDLAEWVASQKLAARK